MAMRRRRRASCTATPWRSSAAATSTTLPWSRALPGQCFYLVYLNVPTDPRSRGSTDGDLGRDPQNLWRALDEAAQSQAPVTVSSDGMNTITVSIEAEAISQ